MPFGVGGFSEKLKMLTNAWLNGEIMSKLKFNGNLSEVLGDMLTKGLPAA